MKTDALLGLAVLLFGLLTLFWLIPQFIPETYSGSYGLYAGSFPRFIAVVITLCAAVLMIQSLRRSDDSPPDDEESPDTPFNLMHLCFSAGAMVLAALTMSRGGFLVGGAMLIGVLMLLMGERRPLPLILTSVLGPVFIWVMVWHVLGYRLP